MNALIFAVAALAVYRASRMITQDGEDGPFDLLARWRERISQKNWIGRGFHCFYCVSVWAALAAALWLGAFGFMAWVLLPFYWFGLSGGAMVIFKVFK